MDWLPRSMINASRVRTLGIDEHLFRKGDTVFGIFEVIKGRLSMVRHTSEGQKVVIHSSLEGSLFAEAALFATEYHCDGVAVEETEVRVFDKDAVFAAFRDNPELAENFMAVLARQVQVLRAKLEQRSIRSARQRLIHHFILSAEEDGRTVPLKGTLKDLAVELGLTHEALYRTLAKLEKEGLVERSATVVLLQPKLFI
ncbi:MAG: Crp/Fnr family transcriptional regulator [Rhodospirillales bacterium]|nr:Crp/Fnr family transcriptional regulator [Rhodospirillales bacterium]